MAQMNPRMQLSTAELVKEALDEGKELVKLEVALAKAEMRREVAAVKASAIAFGVAAVTAILGLSLLLVALALQIDLGPVPALVIGIVLVVAAAIAGLVGYKALPRKPLDYTKRRLETDVHMLKEHVA
jgi:hypothetical protein